CRRELQQGGTRYLVFYWIGEASRAYHRFDHLPVLRKMLQRTRQVHGQHQGQFFGESPPQLLLRKLHDVTTHLGNAFINESPRRPLSFLGNFVGKTLEIMLNIKVQEPANLIFRQTTPAQYTQITTDAIIEVLR